MQRRRVVGALVAGVGVTVLLAGCTVGAEGYTGVMLDESGDLIGVARACRGSMASFAAYEGLGNLGTDRWDFVEPIEAGETRTTRIGTKEEVLSAMREDAGVMFGAGTDDEVGGTYPMLVSRSDIEALESGELVYSRPADVGSELATTTLRAFLDLSCEPFV